MTLKFLTQKILVLVLLAIIVSPVRASGAEISICISAPLAGQNVSGNRSPINAEKFLRTELFFGRNKPDGTEISLEEFADFLNTVIASEFPDGLTVLDGTGQFRDRDGNTIEEKAKILILIYPLNTRRRNNRKIERVRAAYKNRFAQQSVLRVDDVLPVEISF